MNESSKRKAETLEKLIETIKELQGEILVGDITANQMYARLNTIKHQLIDFRETK